MTLDIYGFRLLSPPRFYVHDVSLLEDEVTRYHYFLQLKFEVIEGRLRCNYEQAIVLASYALQVIIIAKCVIN